MAKKQQGSNGPRPRVRGAARAAGATVSVNGTGKTPKTPEPDVSENDIRRKHDLEVAKVQHAKRMAEATNDVEKRESCRQYQIECLNAEYRALIVRASGIKRERLMFERLHRLIRKFGNGLYRELSRPVDSIRRVLFALDFAEDAIRNRFPPLREAD